MLGKHRAALFLTLVILGCGGSVGAQERIRIAWAGASPANAAI